MKANAAARQPKATYHTPTLQEHGSLQELTQASTIENGTNFDSSMGYNESDPGTPGS